MAENQNLDEILDEKCNSHVERKVDMNSDPLHDQFEQAVMVKIKTLIAKIKTLYEIKVHCEEQIITELRKLKNEENIKEIQNLLYQSKTKTQESDIAIQYLDEKDGEIKIKGKQISEINKKEMCNTIDQVITLKLDQLYDKKNKEFQDTIDGKIASKVEQIFEVKKEEICNTIDQTINLKLNQLYDKKNKEFYDTIDGKIGSKVDQILEVKKEEICNTINQSINLKLDQYHDTIDGKIASKVEQILEVKRENNNTIDQTINLKLDQLYDKKNKELYDTIDGKLASKVEQILEVKKEEICNTIDQTINMKLDQLYHKKHEEYYDTIDGKIGSKVEQILEVKKEEICNTIYQTINLKLDQFHDRKTENLNSTLQKRPRSGRYVNWNKQHEILRLRQFVSLVDISCLIKNNIRMCAYNAPISVLNELKKSLDSLQVTVISPTVRFPVVGISINIDAIADRLNDVHFYLNKAIDLAERKLPDRESAGKSLHGSLVAINNLIIPSATEYYPQTFEIENALEWKYD